MHQSLGKIGWFRRGMVVVIGILIGATLLTPAVGHVTSRVNHLWKQHIKAKTDARYVGSRQMLWAFVEADGDLRNGRRATAAQAGDQPGRYVVTFKRNVSMCSWNATLATAFGPAGLITAGGGSDPKTVLVEIHNPTGVEGREAPFSLSVLCQRK